MIGITLGDPGGIGAEVVLKSISKNLIDRIVVIGNYKSFNYYSRKIKIPVEKNLEFINIQGKFHPGKIHRENGEISYRSIIKGINFCKQAKCDALVTAPINKKALYLAGYEYPGHTEILASEYNTTKYAMMMVSNKFRIVFATTHIPIKDVSCELSRELIREKIELAHDTLTTCWKIKEPSFGILALNPHAGDNGIIGREEKEIIIPVIETLKKEGYDVDGPFPSDTYWIQHKKDCTLCMYHDQGMTPVKSMEAEKAVNVTAGLPYPRTSPDHGTAFDIQGKGVADPTSMKKAIKMVQKLINE